MPAWGLYQKTDSIKKKKKSNGNSNVEKYHTEMKSLLDEPIRRFDVKKESQGAYRQVNRN